MIMYQVFSSTEWNGWKKSLALKNYQLFRLMSFFYNNFSFLNVTHLLKRQSHAIFLYVGDPFKRTVPPYFRDLRYALKESSTLFSCRSLLSRDSSKLLDVEFSLKGQFHAIFLTLQRDGFAVKAKYGSQ